jgi:hypothetical protein
LKAKVALVEVRNAYKDLVSTTDFWNFSSTFQFIDKGMKPKWHVINNECGRTLGEV